MDVQVHLLFQGGGKGILTKNLMLWYKIKIGRGSVMAKGDMRYAAVKLQMKGQEVQREIIDFIIRSKLSDFCYAYKCRVKPEKKLLEKVEIKRKKKDYSIHSITDVVGLRLVTLFRTDMIDVVDQLLEIIIEDDHGAGSPFLKCHPEEIIFYSPHLHDEIKPSLTEKIEKHIDPSVLKVQTFVSKEGYSSIHIVTRLNVRVDDINPKGDYYLPVEIQIRTVFEDAWGEIDHRYGYVIRTGKDSGKPINNPEYVLAHLKVLKKFTDACSEYADGIQQEALAARKSLIGGRVISIDADDTIIQRFRALNVGEDIIESYLKLRVQKDEAQTSLNAGEKTGLSLVLRAAEGFKELADGIDISDEENLGNRLAYFYSRMNEGVCLLLTDSRDETISALKVYLSLEESFEKFPLLKMRIGQALSRTGDLKASIEKLNEAHQLMEDLGDLCDGPWPDEAPEVDYKHLVQYVPRLLGFQYWQWSRLPEIDIAKKEDLLKKAYLETTKATECRHIDDNSLLKTQNNLLYYAVDYLNSIPDESKDQDFTSMLKDRLPSHLAPLEKDFSLDDCTDLELLDTFMDTYIFLGQEGKIGPIAQRILTLSLEEGGAMTEQKQALKMMLAEKSFRWLKEHAS